MITLRRPAIGEPLMSSPPHGSLTLRVRLRLIYLNSRQGSRLLPDVRWALVVAAALNERSSTPRDSAFKRLANRPERMTPSVMLIVESCWLRVERLKASSVRRLVWLTRRV